MKESDVTILLTSCDRYADAWKPFFILWKKYWPECDYPFVLNTERENYHSELFSVKTVKGGKGKTWSRRLKNCLNQIDTEFVLLCLEDYFLQRPVDTKIFQAALRTMREDPLAGVIQFAIDIETKFDRSVTVNEYFSPVPKYEKTMSNGRIFCVLSLYRTKYLKKLLLPSETPWDFEYFGSIRSQWYREKVYRENDNHERCFFYYIEPKYGYAISRGKWLPKNQELFEENGIEVDFSRLGIMDEEVYQKLITYQKIPKVRHTLPQKIVMPFIHPTEFWKIMGTIAHRYYIKIKLQFPFLP